jgi:hypothetical protein
MYSLIYRFKSYILLTEWICVFRLTLGLNSDQIPTQYNIKKLSYLVRPVWGKKYLRITGKDFRL